MIKRPASLLLALAVCATLPACVVVPAHGGHYHGGPQVVAPAVVVAPMAPPPAYVEVQPALPFAGAIWISGYWGWVGGRHVWTPGRWDHPRPGYRWEPHRWEQHQGQWHLRGGEWREHRH